MPVNQHAACDSRGLAGSSSAQRGYFDACVASALPLGVPGF